MRAALAQTNPIIGAFAYNCRKLIQMIKRAKIQEADLVVFPELAICGYPPEDLLLLPSFIDAATKSLKEIIQASQNIIVIVGCVRPNPHGGEKGLYNSAAIIENGELIGFQDKSLLPDYDVFSERRYFEPAHATSLWSLGGKRVGITICEDIWQHAKAVEYATYQRDPVEELRQQQPELLINLSASPYYFRRHEIRLEVGKSAAKSLHCPVLFCNQVGGNDSLIFDGSSFSLDAQGNITHHAKSFEEDLIVVDFEKKAKPLNLDSDWIKDLFQALVLGVRDYFHKLGLQKACFGLSGGIDSAVVAVIAQKALGEENLLALRMPSRYTSGQSRQDALILIRTLGLASHEISIEPPFKSLLDVLEPYFCNTEPGIAEENLQARIRGMLLMAFSNKFGYLLLSTGNKSEMAMGYATLYGDMCGGLAVLSDVTKEQVYALARYINRNREIIPLSILEKPPSAELKENQKDTDSLPEYAIVDSVLQAYIEEHLSVEEIAEKNHLSLSLVKELVAKIHANEYKRRQAPPGLRVTKKSFTGFGRRFPIVQHWNSSKGVLHEPN